MLKLTKNEQYAIGAAAIAYASQDDNLRDLSANDRAIALEGRRKAYELLLSAGISPTALKEIGFRLIADAHVNVQ